MFGRKVTFGRKQHTLQDLQEMASHPDSDGVRRVFSKELWDDPKVGSVLREIGMEPDDRRNLCRSGEEWIALFARAKAELLDRLASYNREQSARYGHFEARPFLLIGAEIYDGEHGAFLYGQLDLIAYHDWNVMFLAGDPQSKAVSGLPGHPGRMPVIEDIVAKRVVDWRQRHDFALETWGITATGGSNGISRDDYLQVKAQIRAEVLAWTAQLKTIITEDLLAAQA